MTTGRCDPATSSAAYAYGADAYDDVWSPVILPPAATVVRHLRLEKASRVLDVGTGTGALAPTLRAEAPHALVVGIDPAVQMLRFAHDRRHVTATLGDALALPFADGSFDAVLLAYVLFMLTNPRDGIREAMRVLRPGGRLGTVTWASEEPTVAARTWDDTLEELGVPPLPAHSNHSGLDTSEDVETLLADAGLRRPRTWNETVEHTFDPDSFWRLRTRHGTNRLRLAGLDPDRRERVIQELHERLAPLPPSAYQFRGALICSVSEKPPKVNTPT